MTGLWVAPRKSTIAASLLAVTALGYGSLGHAQTVSNSPSCSIPADVAPNGYLKLPRMTFKITNNSKTEVLYPVISTGATQPSSFWMQAGFCVPAAQLETRTFANKNIFRLYVNPAKGIAPGASVMVTLPLWSQLAPGPLGTPSGDEYDQYINWWQGGRISLTTSRGTIAANIAADKKENAESGFAGPVKGSPLVECDSCEPLVVYQATADELPNQPTQLTEYTLAATDTSKSPIGIDTKIVGYNISYVNSAALPVAMGTYGNPFVGWVGSTQPTSEFQATLKSFYASNYRGWPKFRTSAETPVVLSTKAPSTGTLYANYSGANPPTTVTAPGLSFNNMKANWKYCVAHTENTGEVCSIIREVNALFLANYSRYVANYSSEWECPGVPRSLTSTNGENWFLSKVYGWVPFNETPAGEPNEPAPKCGKPITNEIIQSTGYDEAKVIKISHDYIRLQYMTKADGVVKGDAFNPYVQLIHGSTPPNAFLGIKSSYAFSIDDGVGFVAFPGSGLAIAVGGAANLPNVNPFDPGAVVTFGGLSGPYTMFGYCEAGSPDIEPNGVCPLMLSTTGYIGSRGPVLPAVRYHTTGGTLIVLLDKNNRKYQFIINSLPPFSGTRANPSNSMVSCVPNDPNGAWCKGLEGFTDPVGSPDLPPNQNFPANFVNLPPPLK